MLGVGLWYHRLYGVRMGVLNGKCVLCQGTGEAINRPSRLIGATYRDGDLGDERLEPCPICCKDTLDGKALQNKGRWV